MALTEERKRYLAKWREKNREHLRAYHFQWSREHGVRSWDSWREDTFGTPEERAENRKAKAAAWQKANPEKMKATKQRYRDRHPGRRAEQLRKWRDSEKGKEWNEAYRDQNRENYTRSYYQNHEWNKLLRRVRSARRKARKLNAAGDASPEAIEARVAYYGGLCWMCREAEGTALDHVIPLAKGGSNWPANLRPACQPCNTRKHAKHPKEVYSPIVAVAVLP